MYSTKDRSIEKSIPTQEANKDLLLLSSMEDDRFALYVQQLFEEHINVRLLILTGDELKHSDSEINKDVRNKEKRSFRESMLVRQ